MPCNGINIKNPREGTMDWKSEIPNIPGFYWFRDSFGNEPEIVKLASDGLNIFGEAGIAEVSSYADGEWYGPLLPPV
jgi:hypothetical protein